MILSVNTIYTRVVPKQAVIENWWYWLTYAHTSSAALRHCKQTHPKPQVYRGRWPLCSCSTAQQMHHTMSTCVNGCAWMSSVQMCPCVCATMVWECCFPPLICRAKQQLVLTADQTLSCRPVTQKINRGQGGKRVETQKKWVSSSAVQCTYAWQ